MADQHVHGVLYVVYFRDCIYSLAMFADCSFLEPPGWTQVQSSTHSVFKH